jgi:hypothetical protein
MIMTKKSDLRFIELYYDEERNCGVLVIWPKGQKKKSNKRRAINRSKKSGICNG